MAAIDGKNGEKGWLDASYARFLSGAALGGFFWLIPLLYSDVHTWKQITGVQLGLGVCVVLGCGGLAAKWGTRFIDAVISGVENAGF